MTLTHVSLFTGIGGADLAAEWAGFETICQCEIDPFCQKILNKNFPGIPIIGDVHDVTYAAVRRLQEQGLRYENKQSASLSSADRALSREAIANSESVKEYSRGCGNVAVKASGRQGSHSAVSSGNQLTLLTAGVPCQPASAAGKRLGKKDDRWLWPEAIRVLSELSPTWAVFENPAGIGSLGELGSFAEMDGEAYQTIPDREAVELSNIIRDIEAQGYEVQPVCIPACAVGAPHRRDRIFIVSHALDNIGQSGRARQNKRGMADSYQQEIRVATDSQTERSQRAGKSRTGWSGLENGIITDPNSNNSASSRYRENGRGIHGEPESEGLNNSDRFERNDWAENWIEVATRFCTLDAGFSAGLAGCRQVVETHGIMGLVILLRRYHYANAEETRTGKILPVLQGAFGEKDYQRAFGRLSTVYTPEILRCPVHGERDDQAKSRPNDVPQTSEKTSQNEMRDMRNESKTGSTSSERGYNGQCTCEFDDIVYELSSEMALAEWENHTKEIESSLFDLWQTSRGERFLHEPLQALYEIWQSVTNKKVGDFRRSFNQRNSHRVQKLKALGNAIVPQQIYPILKPIAEIEIKQENLV